MSPGLLTILKHTRIWLIMTCACQAALKRLYFIRPFVHSFNFILFLGFISLIQTSEYQGGLDTFINLNQYFYSARDHYTDFPLTVKHL